MAEVTIRRAVSDDWALVRDVRLRALAESPSAFGSTLAAERDRPEEAWRAWMEDPERVVVIAERDGRGVGMASGGPAPVPERRAGLYAMWLDPECRGSGVAAAIVDEVEAWAIERGYGSIGLGVAIGNERAIAFYRRVGYADTGERWAMSERAEARMAIMTKDLQAPLR